VFVQAVVTIDGKPGANGNPVRWRIACARSMSISPVPPRNSGARAAFTPRPSPAGSSDNLNVR